MTADFGRIELPRLVRDIRTISVGHPATDGSPSGFPTVLRPFSGLLGFDPWRAEWPQLARSFLRLTSQVGPAFRDVESTWVRHEVEAHPADDTADTTSHDDASGGGEIRVRDLVAAHGATDQSPAEDPQSITGGTDTNQGPPRPDDVQFLRSQLGIEDLPTPIEEPDSDASTNRRAETSQPRARLPRVELDELVRPQGTAPFEETTVRDDDSPISGGPTPSHERSPTGRPPMSADEGSAQGRRSSIAMPDPPPMVTLRGGRVPPAHGAPSADLQSGRAGRRPSVGAPPSKGRSSGNTHTASAERGDPSNGDRSHPRTPSERRTPVPHLDELIDVDRLADRLARVFERKSRIERERRGR